MTKFKTSLTRWFWRCFSIWTVASSLIPWSAAWALWFRGSENGSYNRFAILGFGILVTNVLIFTGIVVIRFAWNETTDRKTTRG